MRPLRSLAVYVVVVFLGGAVLAPWIYWLVQWTSVRLPALENVAGEPFHRYVNRCLLGLALVGIWPLMRALGLGSWRSLGLVPTGRWGRQWVAGLGLGLASMGLVSGVSLLFGGREVAEDLVWTSLLKKCASAAGSALVVSFLEEVLFRGAIFGALWRAYGLGRGLLLSGLIFGMVHFLARPAAPSSVEWWTGILMLGRMLGGFTEVAAWVPGFLNLTAVGVLLGVAYDRTGSLYLPMGVHAGWIVVAKLHGYGTREVPGTMVAVWGSDRMFDGWVALIVLALLGWAIHHFVRKEVGIGLAVRENAAVD